VVPGVEIRVECVDGGVYLVVMMVLGSVGVYLGVDGVVRMVLEGGR